MATTEVDSAQNGAIQNLVRTLEELLNLNRTIVSVRWSDDEHTIIITHD